eukprot:c18662_g1_i3.p1 GENE.c18662_g1_i3~~c18662_g1_i3.p1  ORF type:complete len:201 (+),score=11.16 c18662_g1_i3:108-710(+)
MDTETPLLQQGQPLGDLALAGPQQGNRNRLILQLKDGAIMDLLNSSNFSPRRLRLTGLLEKRAPESSQDFDSEPQLQIPVEKLQVGAILPFASQSRPETVAPGQQMNPESATPLTSFADCDADASSNQVWILRGRQGRLINRPQEQVNQNQILSIVSSAAAESAGVARTEARANLGAGPGGRRKYPISGLICLVLPSIFI